MFAKKPCDFLFKIILVIITFLLPSANSFTVIFMLAMDVYLLLPGHDEGFHEEFDNMLERLG